MDNYESSTIYRWFIPSALLVLGAVMLPSSVALAFREHDWADAGFTLTVGVICLLLFQFGRKKFGKVVVDKHGVSVVLNGRAHQFDWSEVGGFFTVPFVQPAVHRLSFSDGTVVYFTPRNGTTLDLFGLWTFHFDGMGKFIKNQLRQARQQSRA